MKISIFGSGGWGTAIAVLLHENGHDVTLWSYLPEEAETLKRTRENPKLKGVPIPEGVAITCDIEEAARGAELAVLSTPSFAVRETAGRLRGYLKPTCVKVSVSKGIEQGSLKRFSQAIAEELGTEENVAVLSGPSHAEEVGRGVPTACVSASRSYETARFVQDAFMSERFRVYTSNDVTGVELCAALKNIIALASGICVGLGLGDNSLAMLMTRGLSEIALLGTALGAERETFAGLSGIGDLIVTCTSDHSRNRRAGVLIGQGFSAKDAMEKVGAVVEGYYAAAAAMDLSKKAGVEMPISQETYKVLYEGKDPSAVVYELMTRPKKTENVSFLFDTNLR